MNETDTKRDTSDSQTSDQTAQMTTSPNPIFLIAGYIFVPLIISFLTTIIGIPHSSYFGSSKNLFNLIFAKKAWLWTTIVYIIHLFYSKPKQIQNSLVRYFLASAYWYILTQALFGSYNFRQHVLLATGATCIPGGDRICQLAAGEKIVGHLISGHCLLLIHSSLFIWEEFYPDIVRKGNQFSVLLLRILLGFSFFMLMTTSVYFHTLFEKITGVFFGSLFWYVGYYVLYPKFGLNQ